MKFFDNKEDVLDIELTPHGETMLSKGLFKPVYYAFFDDDILYDASGSAGIKEHQNSIETRIQSDTPRSKAQYLFSGVESNLSPQIIANRANDAEPTPIQPTMDRNYALAEPLGTMDLGSKDAPSWNVQILDGELSGALNYITTTSASQNTFRIPQLDFDIEYSAVVGNTRDFDVNNPDFAEKIISRVYSNGTYIYLTEKNPQLILSIDEENATDETEYDIEVFLMESGSQGPESVLTPLSFLRGTERVVDNILIDEPTGRRTNRRSFRMDSTYAEYFFNVNADLEIPEEEICSLIAELRTRGIHVDDIPYDCPDVIGSRRFDVYSTDVVPEECE